jgi:hypothetical protein
MTRKNWTGRALALGSFALGILTEAVTQVRAPVRGAPPGEGATPGDPPVSGSAGAAPVRPLPLASARPRSRRRPRSPAAPARPRRPRSTGDGSPST